MLNESVWYFVHLNIIFLVIDDEENEGKRPITYEIAKNKGLTPHRKKELRNPRVKHRMKYRKAKIRRKGQVNHYFYDPFYIILILARDGGNFGESNLMTVKEQIVSHVTMLTPVPYKGSLIIYKHHFSSYSLIEVKKFSNKDISALLVANMLT